jgi:hypothetical protein
MRIALLVIAALTAGCTSNADSYRALNEAGYSDVTLDGFAWLQCGKDDTFATSFRAKGPTGVAVKGAVCCGLMKGCTIRH